jgi:hypothetical protein
MRDSLFETPSPWIKWFSGMVAPLLVAAYGAHCCVVQKWVWRGRYGSRFVLLDADAVAMGIVIIGIAFLIHVKYFWNASLRMAYYEVAGQIIGSACIAGGLVFILLNNLFSK